MTFQENLSWRTALGSGKYFTWLLGFTSCVVSDGMMQLLVMEGLGTVVRYFVIAPACEIRSRVAKGGTAPGRDVGPVANKCL